MKKVTILVLHLGYGGIEKAVSELANMLVNKYEVEIVSTYKLYDEEVFKLDKKVIVKYLTDSKPNKKQILEATKKKNIFKIIKEMIKGYKIVFNKYSKVIKYLKELDSDYVITTRIIHNKLLVPYCDSKVKKIAWEHNHHNNNLRYTEKVINSVEGIDAFVLVSKELKEFYQKALPNIKCSYIPNVIEEVSKIDNKLDSKNIVAIGRLEDVKAFDELIEVYKEVNKTNPDWTLTIIGDGSKKQELQELINSYKLEDEITLTGFLSKEEIDKVLKKSSIYVMTSYTEAFGIVLLEAMSHNIPCISYTSAQGATEIIDKNTGILIEGRNRDKMVKAINKLIKNKDERLKLGLNGKEKCKKYLSSNVKEDWFKLLEDLNEEDKRNSTNI